MTLDKLINLASFYPNIDWLTLTKFEIKEMFKSDEFKFIKEINNALFVKRKRRNNKRG